MDFFRSDSQRSTLSLMLHRATRYQKFLNISNVILLITSTILIVFAAILMKFYHMDKLGFWSEYFAVFPNYVIYLSIYTFGVSLFGFFITGMERRRYLIAYGVMLSLAFFSHLGSIFTALELRNIISQAAVGAADVNEDLSMYGIDAAITRKWDVLQRDLYCCGGHNFLTGYTDYRTTSIGKENSVPDSCCFVEMENCGRNILAMPQEYIRNKIFVHGCLALLEDQMETEILPLLIIYSCVCLALSLTELMTVVLSSAFIAQISRRNKRESGWKLDEHLATMSDEVGTEI